MLRPCPLLLMVVVALLPAAQAAPVTLYAHVYSGYQEFPLSTQQPPDSFHIDEGVGLVTPTLSCLPPPPLMDTKQEHHTLYGYQTPSYIDYEAMQNDVPRVHPERGVQTDVLLDADAPMALHWYLSEPLLAPGEAAQPVPVPDVVVRATMRTGDSISVADAGYNTGTVLAHGTSPPATLAGPASQGIETSTVNGRTVYHFRVPMTIDSALIARHDGFNLRVDTYMQSEACPDGGLMPNSVLLHSSAGHRPRLEFGVRDPLKLESLHPQFVGRDLFLHTEVIDPWGLHDLVSWNATIEGPGLPETPMAPLVVVREAYEHHHYGQPAAKVAYVLANGTEVLDSANYTFRVSFSTLQGHQQTWEAHFQLGEENAAPALPAGILAAALAGLAAALPRRRT